MFAKILFATVLLAMATAGYTQAQKTQSGSSDSNILEIKAINIKDIRATLGLMQAQPDAWTFELTVSNEGQQSVFVMTEPIRSSGEKGPYIALDEDTSQTLIINIMVYPPPRYFDLYKNSAGVKLEKLAPTASHTERFIIKLPLLETMPPYGMSGVTKKIDSSDIKFIKAFIGLLPDEEGTRDILQRKVAGPFIYGLEKVMAGSFKGRFLIELQTVVSSNTIKLGSRVAKLT